MKIFPLPKSRGARIALAAFALTTAYTANERSAAAVDDCTWLSPLCGALTNHTPSTVITVRWKDNDAQAWQYDSVEPDTTMGGFWNDVIDVDYWWIPPGCTDRGGIGGTAKTWDHSNTSEKGDGWNKIDSDQTVVIDSRTCEPPPNPEPPPPPPYPAPTCSAQTRWPTTKSWINIFTTAIAKAGTNNSCSTVGRNYTGSNPQYIWCRKWGGEVRDAQGNYNHWWLWTDLDTGGRGWISAYYIQGQGNDQANDKNTGKPIPNCP